MSQALPVLYEGEYDLFLRKDIEKVDGKYPIKQSKLIQALLTEMKMGKLSVHRKSIGRRFDYSVSDTEADSSDFLYREDVGNLLYL